jgi:predicted transcriptional regulator
MVKELQPTSEEIRFEVSLSKHEFYHTAWDRAAILGNVEVIQKLWYLAIKCS